MRRIGWADVRHSFGNCKAMLAWLSGVVHWSADHRRYCWERLLSSSASRTELNESSPLIIPYLVDLLHIAHQHPDTQLPRQEQVDTMLPILLPLVNPAIPPNVCYDQDQENGVKLPTTRLFVPSLYAMTAIFRLYQSCTVTQEVLTLCESNLSIPSCHPRIAFQSACLLLSHHRHLTPESVWRRVMSATEEPLIVSDGWMDSSRDGEQWMGRCHALLKLVSSDEVIGQLIQQLAGVKDKPEDAFPLMRRMIDLAFESVQVKQYVYDETTDGHNWTYSGGKRTYNKYLQPAGEGAGADGDPDAVVNIDDIDPADLPAAEPILLSSDLNGQQHRVVLSILSCPACWEIHTNLYSLFRLPDQLKNWTALLTGTEWEEQGKKIAEEREKEGKADASQVKGMQIPYPAGSKAVKEDGEKAGAANVEVEKKEEEEGHDHHHAEGGDEDEDDEHAGSGGCGHGHQAEEVLPDDKIPTEHADTVKTLSTFSSSAPPLPSSASSAHLLAAAFHRLRCVPWSKLHHAYGAASDVPFFLRLLCHPRYSKRHAVVDTLYSNIYHQGSLYSATPFAVPFLMDVLRICVRHTALQAWDRTQRLGCLSARNDPLSSSCHSPALLDISSVLGYLNHLTQGYFGSHQINKGYQKALQVGICSQLDVLLSLLQHEDQGIVCQAMSLLGRLEQRVEEAIAALIPFIDTSVPAPKQRPWDNTYELDDLGELIPLGDRPVEINTPTYSPATSAMAAIHQLAARYPNNEQLLSLCRSNLQHPNCQPEIAFRSAHTLVMHDKEKADDKSLSILAVAYGTLDALVKGRLGDGDCDGVDLLTDLFAASAYLPPAQWRSCLLSSLQTTHSADFVLRIVQKLLSIDFKERWCWTDYHGAWTGKKMKLYGNYGLLVSDLMMRPGQKLATEEDKVEVWEKRQHPLTADELTAKQKEVVQAMLQCDVLWGKHVTNYWEKYGLPKERNGVRRVVWREETERVLPSVSASLTKADATAEEKEKAMEVLVLLQPSHPDVIALCSQVLHTPECSAQLAYLASYMLLAAGQAESPSTTTPVQHVVNGLTRPGWLWCHDDLLLGLSPALRLAQLQPPSSALSALTSALPRCDDVQVASSVAYAMLAVAEFNQVHPFDKVEIWEDQQNNTQTLNLSFACWSIMPKHLLLRQQSGQPQEPSVMKEEELTSELQRDVVSALVDTGLLWSNNVSSLFCLFKLPGSRAGMMQLLRKKNSELLIPALLPLFDTHNDQEAVKTMEQMVHLDDSNPQLVALCEQVVRQQPPHESASGHVRFLASYCLLQHQKEATDVAVVESVVSGVLDHSDWLECFGNAVVGSSPLAALKLLSHSDALNALVSLAERVRADHPASKALVSALLSLSFTEVQGDWKERRALPMLTAASLTSEQRRVLRAVLQCSRPTPQAEPQPLFSHLHDLYQCNKYRLPTKRQELHGLLEGEGAEGVDVERDGQVEGADEEGDVDDGIHEDVEEENEP